MSTGNQAIYDKIDHLDEARTPQELAERLKPILNFLVYYAATGEGAVMDAHEEWHQQYTDALYSADDSTPVGSTSSAPARPQGKGKGKKSVPGLEPPVEHRRMAQPPANRPRPSDLSDNLRRIMEGTHPSLKDDK